MAKGEARQHTSTRRVVVVVVMGGGGGCSGVRVWMNCLNKVRVKDLPVQAGATDTATPQEL